MFATPIVSARSRSISLVAHDGCLHLPVHFCVGAVAGADAGADGSESCVCACACMRGIGLSLRRCAVRSFDCCIVVTVCC